MADLGKQPAPASLEVAVQTDALGQGWRKLLWLSAALLLAVFAAIKLLPVRYVRIEGELRQVDPVALQAALEPLLESGYLRVNLNAVEATSRAQPWVGEVTVKRLWPETLLVKVEELTAFARMEDGSFVSEKGVRFFAGKSLSSNQQRAAVPCNSAALQDLAALSDCHVGHSLSATQRAAAPCNPAVLPDCHVGQSLSDSQRAAAPCNPAVLPDCYAGAEPLQAAEAKLPLLRGPDGYEKPMLAMLKTMNAKLAPLGKRIAELQLSSRRAWTVKLEDGLEVAMGKQDVLTAFERFITLAGLLGAERLQVVQRVDFRYPNGCAVSMKPKAELKFGG